MPGSRDQPAHSAGTTATASSAHPEAGERAEESRFDALLAAVVDAVIVIGGDGRIRTFSPSAERMFGYRSAEVLGKNVSLLMPEPFQSEHDGYLRAYRRSGIRKIIGIGREVKAVKNDGTVFAIDLSVGEARIDGEDVFVGVVRDLTHKNAAQAALRESQRALSTLAENLPGMVYRCENDAAWTMRSISGGSLALTGYAPDALVDGDIGHADLVHPDDRARVRQAVDAALARREPFGLTYRIVTRSGDERWVFERGIGVYSDESDERDSVRFIEGFVEDVTDRVRSADLLREKDELIQVAFDHAPIAIITSDLEGKVLSANRSASRILGYSLEELRAMNVAELADREIGARIREQLSRVRHGLIGEYAEDRQYVRKDGSVVDGRTHASAVHDDDGRPMMLVIQFEDLTERRRAEGEAERLRESLAHVGRLGALGEMATGIAHEINQPLTAISNYAQACRFMLERGSIDQARFREILDKISLSARRAGEVIRHLRTLVRKRVSKREQVQINELIADVAALMEVDARLRDSSIQLDLGELVRPVVADRVHIQQVVLNLMRNGLDAMKDVDPCDKRLVVKTEARGDSEVEIAVEDRGSGIPESLDEDLFHPFVTTKASGMGIGLSICRSIVDAHGGRLWFTRNHEGGTTFRFTLPTALEAPGE